MTKEVDPYPRAPGRGDGSAPEGALPQPHLQLHVPGLGARGAAAAPLHAGHDPHLLTAPERHGRDLKAGSGRLELDRKGKGRGTDGTEAPLDSAIIIFMYTFSKRYLNVMISVLAVKHLHIHFFINQ